MRYVRMIILLAIPLGIFGGCINSIYQASKEEPPADDEEKPKPSQAGKEPPPSKPPQPAKEPWASKPPEQWPQIVLTNQATFRDHTGLNGASAFLVRDQGGRTFAATARHLLGSAGGVRPEVKVEKLDGVLIGWKLHPRTRENETVSLDRAEFAGGDVLVLSVKPQKEPLPATPLPLRDEPARVGEKVYVLGCPYSEGGCQQNVYSGRVLRRGDGHSFLFSISPPVEIRGFSGAPVIDENGYAVGVLTAASLRTPDGKNKEAGAEDLTPFHRGSDLDSPIILTESAAKNLRGQLADRGWPQGVLRVSRKKDSLQGIGLELINRSPTGDWVGQSKGLVIVVPRADLPDLWGTTIDYWEAINMFLFDKVFRRRQAN